MSGFFSSNDILFKTLLIYVVMGLSVQVVLRAGVFSLASAGFWGISAYTTALLVDDLGWALAGLVGLVLSLVISALLALLLGRLRGLYLGMATIAFDLLVVALANSWDSLTGGPAGLFNIPRPLSLVGSLAIAVVCVLAVALWHSRAGGRFADVLRTDEPLAKTLGVETQKLRVATFVFSAGLGAVSGSMAALTYGVLGPNDSGFSLVVLALTIVVLGGSSSWVGALIGAVVVTLLPQFLGFLSEWGDLVYGALVVVVVLFAPKGLLGLLRKVGDLRHRPPPDGPPTAAPEQAERQPAVRS
ncbi:hypothetical protein GIS00_07895 [Nakamurella sp. YIM 132087]|uniref:Branched-chain amino acid ABC transporter permease n=1 Tax=Nakamurella alba TaxID=2665158 RepID=A0A7K1FIC1_9ACTN|nr:branched-chain amino acid ABC transporter permease [Nakamurella alba]MTD13862.1 hypothetical protein [Nakamurella alba]